MATDQIARGLAAKTAATVRTQSVALEEFGATGIGNDRAAVQRAIDTAVARAGVAAHPTKNIIGNARFHYHIHHRATSGVCRRHVQFSKGRRCR